LDRKNLTAAVHRADLKQTKTLRSAAAAGAGAHEGRQLRK